MKALKIAKQNRVIANARWDAKINKFKHGIPLGSPLPPLVEHPSFYSLADSMRVEVLPCQPGCSSNAGFHLWNQNGNRSGGAEILGAGPKNPQNAAS